MHRLNFVQLCLLALLTVLSSQSKEAKRLASGQNETSPRHGHDVERITMSSSSWPCQTGFAPREDSYYITATGTDGIVCPLQFNGIDAAIVRLGSSMAEGESFQLVSTGSNLSVTPQTPMYACYFLFDGPFGLIYRKQSGVQPRVNVLITSAKCRDRTESCEVTCRVDGCTIPNSAGCTQACIDEDYRCNRYQQCPYGEDESCGQITTVTPATQTTQTTRSSSTIFPSHIRTIFTGANQPGCSSATPTYVNQEMIITNMNQPSWTGKCWFQFISPDRGVEEDDMTVIRLEGQLGGSESVVISGGTGKFTLNHKTKAGECFITTGGFSLNYESRGPATQVWKLISTPIDCGEDEHCPARCSTSDCHHGRPRPCKRSGCIRHIDICDGVQQCPKGEDESCGQIVTILPPHHGLSGGYILLIVLAVVAVVAGLVAGAFYLAKRRKHKESSSGTSAMDSYPFPHSNFSGGVLPDSKKDVRDEENIYEVA